MSEEMAVAGDNVVWDVEHCVAIIGPPEDWEDGVVPCFGDQKTGSEVVRLKEEVVSAI